MKPFQAFALRCGGLQKLNLRFSRDLYLWSVATQPAVQPSLFFFFFPRGICSVSELSHILFLCWVAFLLSVYVREHKHSSNSTLSLKLGSHRLRICDFSASSKLLHSYVAYKTWKRMKKEMNSLDVFTDLARLMTTVPSPIVLPLLFCFFVYLHSCLLHSILLALCEKDNERFCECIRWLQTNDDNMYLLYLRTKSEYLCHMKYECIPEVYFLLCFLFYPVVWDTG